MNNREECWLDQFCRESFQDIVEEIMENKYKGVLSAEPEPVQANPRESHEVIETLDQSYRNREDVLLSMDIFAPAAAKEAKVPVILTIHREEAVFEDRSLARRYGRSLAGRGFLVFSLSYRPATRVNICQQLDDLSAGLNEAAGRLADYHGDAGRVFLTAESTGAYLAIYLAAMKESEKLRDAIGYDAITYERDQLTFQALGLFSGIFYRDGKDPFSWLLTGQLSGKELDEAFLPYLNPEHKEILFHLPPVFLVTSRGDLANQASLSYHDALKKAGRKSHLVYYGETELGHAFPYVRSRLLQSAQVIDKMTDWFEDQAAQAVRRQKDQAEEENRYKAILARLESGEIIEQKSWAFIRELNSWSKDRLDAIAIIDGSRQYSYRQMFRKWENVAAVFSSMGITGRESARVGMTGTPCTETLFAFYGLNMTGTSVSMIHYLDIGDPDRWRQVIEKEGITDLVLTDYEVKPAVLLEILKEKAQLGIRSVIILHVPVCGPFSSEAERKESRRKMERLKGIRGIAFMDDLLDQYEGMPVIYGEDPCDDAALIIHTSGTSKGVHKPIPLSDRAFNESVARLVRDSRFEHLSGKAVTCQIFPLSFSYGMIDGNHLPLAFGGTIVMLPTAGLGIRVGKALSYYKANILFSGGAQLGTWDKMGLRMDLSNLEFVFLGGGYVSAQEKKRYDAFLKRNGAKVKTAIGYGLSEAGAACILASPDREDDAMGRPLSGVRVKVYNEEEDRYYEPEDGPRTGILYLSTPSLSSGRIDDTVFFELENIDGDEYLNTFDLVRVNEDGSLTYAGRADKYFVNNEGIRFDAGLVEAAISSRPGIVACGLAPEFSKMIHDSIPVLYVETVADAGLPVHVVRQALKDVFIKENQIAETNLPGKCVITDAIPFNTGGKVDVYRIMNGEIRGRAFTILPIRSGKKLTDIKLLPGLGDAMSAIPGPPEELEGHVRKMIKDMIEKNQIE